MMSSIYSGTVQQDFVMYVTNQAVERALTESLLGSEDNDIICHLTSQFPLNITVSIILAVREMDFSRTGILLHGIPVAVQSNLWQSSLEQQLRASSFTKSSSSFADMNRSGDLQFHFS